MIFNTYYKVANISSHSCASKFMQKRSDDNEKTIRNRFITYSKETLPVLNHYRGQNLLYEIDGMNKIHNIYKEIREIIRSLAT